MSFLTRWMGGCAVKGCVWFVVAVLLFLVSGCKKEPVNGSIEGHWQLLEFTILESGEVVPCERLFYGITHKVTKVCEKQGTHGYRECSALTEYRDHESVLVLKDFKVFDAEAKVAVDATVEQLLPFGIDNPKETVFRVVESSHKNMVLESDYARVVLRRF